MYVCMYVCMYVYIYIYMYTYNSGRGYATRVYTPPPINVCT